MMISPLPPLLRMLAVPWTVERDLNQGRRRGHSVSRWRRAWAHQLHRSGVGIGCCCGCCGYCSVSGGLVTSSRLLAPQHGVRSINHFLHLVRSENYARGRVRSKRERTRCRRVPLRYRRGERRGDSRH